MSFSRCKKALLIPLIIMGPDVFAASKKVMRFAYWESAPRMYTVSGRPSGSSVLFAREFARRAGYDAVFVDCPIKRCLKMAEEGKIDFLSALKKTPDRQRILVYLDPPVKYNSRKCFYQKVNSKKKISNYDDLKGLRIGTRFGAKNFPRFDKDDTLDKEPVSDMRLNLDKLKRGRIHAVLGPAYRLDHQILFFGYDDSIKKSDYCIDEYLDAHVFSMAKKSPLAGSRKAFEKILAAMQADGTYDKLVTNYSLNFKSLESASAK